MFQIARRPHRVLMAGLAERCGMNMRVVLWIIIGLTSVPSAALAQTDEIQVYDAEIEPPGIFNLGIMHFTKQD